MPELKTSQIQALKQQIEDARKLKRRTADRPNFEGWKTRTEMLICLIDGDDSIALRKFRKLTFARGVPVAVVLRNGTTRPSRQELRQIDESAYQDDLDAAIGIIEAVIKTSKLSTTSASDLATERSGADFIKAELDKLSIRKTLKDIVQLLIEDADRAYQAKAYVAAVLLYRSIIEAILLGLLLKRRSKAEDPSGKDVPKDNKGDVKPVVDWKLEQMIKRAVTMGLVDVTDESSIRTLQNYGNLVHAARILKTEPFADPPEDAKIVRSHLIKLLKRYGAIGE